MRTMPAATLAILLSLPLAVCAQSSVPSWAQDQLRAGQSHAATPPADAWRNPQSPAADESQRLKLQPPAHLEHQAGQPAPKRLGNSSSGGAMVVWTMTVLGFVCLLMLGLSRMLRKKMGLAGRHLPSEAFDLIGRKQLLPNQQVLIVRLGSKLLLLASGPDGLRTLSEVSDPVEVDLITGLCREQEQGVGSSTQFLKLFSRSFTPEASPRAAMPLATTIQPEDDPFERLRSNLTGRHELLPRGGRHE